MTDGGAFITYHLSFEKAPRKKIAKSRSIIAKKHRGKLSRKVVELAKTVRGARCEDRHSIRLPPPPMPEPLLSHVGLRLCL